jgi:hypothetical protein
LTEHYFGEDQDEVRTFDNPSSWIIITLMPPIKNRTGLGRPYLFPQFPATHPADCRHRASRQYSRPPYHIIRYLADTITSTVVDSTTTSRQ